MQTYRDSQNRPRRHDPMLSSTLGVLVVVSVFGLVYCILILTNAGAARMTALQLLLYTGWFAVSAVSAYAMLHWKLWGVFALGAATLIVTVVDILNDWATWGGATLGLLITFILVAYLRQSVVRE